MFRKFVTFVMVIAICQASAALTFAKTTAEKEARQVEKVKAALQKLGTGEKARVKLVLKDKTKLTGYVSENSAEAFTVTNPETGTTTTVTYPQVGKVKGHNLNTGAKIAIGVGIAIAIAVVVLFATNEDEIQFPN